MLDVARQDQAESFVSMTGAATRRSLYRDWHLPCSLLGSRQPGPVLPWSQRIEHRRYDSREDMMDAKQVAAAESLYRTATRLQRVGLIIDRNSLSPAQRRAAFALQCLTASCPEEEEPEPQRALIGFAYPNAR
jgi:hypothetical protein